MAAFVTGLIAASAASLGGINTSDLGADAAVVASCDTVGGVDADYANTIPGGDGSGVKIIDIEGGWRTTHEDLSGNPPFVQMGGQIPDLSWRNHGTAVMGEIMGVVNATGIRGIAPAVQWGYSSIAGNSTSNALNLAGGALSPGDAVLIELHTPGPHFNFQSRDDQLGYVAMEYFPASFAAIEQLSADGIIVCEAAGNGAENYDDVLYGQLFDTTFRNSRAIMCGAGAPPSGAFGQDRARLSFSNYGERVNLQGYGRGVTTLGYGGLFNGGTEDSWYTQTFSGTSSASPIVTGAVLAMQGAFKAAFGIPMDADEMRTILSATGSVQQGNTSQHIGPRPNLQAAFDEVLGVAMTATNDFGLAPHTVDFAGLSSKTVNTWLWDFGDGASSTLQSPSHTYDSGALYDVSLTIQAVEGDFSTTRFGFVAVVADTIIGPSAEGAPGDQVRIDVYARNTLPTFQIKVPVSYAGPLGLTLESASVIGLRSSGMNLVLISTNPFSKDATYTITAPSSGTGSYLPAGTGPLLSLFFNIPNGAPTDSNLISFAGWGPDLPTMVTDWGSYNPPTIAATISLACVKAGDANGSGGINIADVTFLIARIFAGGMPPNPLALGDANCDTSVNIGDITFLIARIFAMGPAPCACAP
ncbi:MAG: S8 family serine peptidase [candidate division Zixibacteria bacterium]|nr:S8 family serine peptidase [candidate division Zixibacteria bacterium]